MHITHTLLRLRARAGQLPQPHAAIAQLCDDGRPRADDLRTLLGVYDKRRASRIEQATADLIAAGILAVEPMFAPAGRRTRCAPVEVLRLTITPDTRAAA
jgi:hypothetical protein